LLTTERKFLLCAHMIHYQTFPPSPTLSNWIRFFWVLESDQPYLHYGLADACAEWVFHYKGSFEIESKNSWERSFRSGISGPCQHWQRFATQDPGFGIFGIYLYPSALPLLFGQPSRAFCDQMIDLESLLGSYAPELEEQIMTAKSSSQRINLIEAFFLRKLRHYQARASVVPQILPILLEQAPGYKIKELAQKCGLSERQLERQFAYAGGFSPRKFLRLARFQACTQAYGRLKINLTQLALDRGYYDQSHFIQDFRQFSGLKPRDFFSGKTPATTWRD
ncbi:MAG: helix-turn-helix domain-containing protein, partial [Bacteroidota bacterium]